jgi:hypothetical protein|tara:strand:- start:106 stop:303 length:198 start_codon:yes stop_codon:yes gene_type:complete
LKTENIKDWVVEKLAIIGISFAMFLIICLIMPFIPHILADLSPEPLKSFFEWIVDYGVAISWFQP